jgi:chromosome partitioning protein
MGKRVLTVEFDPQANLSIICALYALSDESYTAPTVATLIGKLLDGEELPRKDEYIQKIGKVDLIPSCSHLSVVEANLFLERGSDHMLSSLLDPLRDDYDFIIVDTNPSLGTLTVNALTAADSVIITADPQICAVTGLQELTKTIIKFKRRLNPKLCFGGILLTMCEKRTNLYKKISDEIREAYQSGMRIYDTAIPRSIKVGDANDKGLSVMEFDSKNPAALAYMDFAKEVAEYVGA